MANNYAQLVDEHASKFGNNVQNMENVVTANKEDADAKFDSLQDQLRRLTEQFNTTTIGGANSTGQSSESDKREPVVPATAFLLRAESGATASEPQISTQGVATEDPRTQRVAAPIGRTQGVADGPAGEDGEELTLCSYCDVYVEPPDAAVQCECCELWFHDGEHYNNHISEWPCPEVYTCQLCNLPIEDENWKGCDVCENWFHIKCHRQHLPFCGETAGHIPNDPPPGLPTAESQGTVLFFVGRTECGCDWRSRKIGKSR